MDHEASATTQPRESGDEQDSIWNGFVVKEAREQAEGCPATVGDLYSATPTTHR